MNTRVAKPSCRATIASAGSGRSVRTGSRRHRSRTAGFTLVEIMIVVGIIGLLAAITVPNLIRARKRAQATALLEEVKLIDAAKAQFAVENNKPGSFVPKVADIRPYLKPGSDLYNTVQLSNFRDLFGRSIIMGDLDTPPLIDDATRDEFSTVVTTAEFWGTYAR